MWLVIGLGCWFSTTRNGCDPPTTLKSKKVVLSKRKKKSDLLYESLAPPQYGWAHYLGFPGNYWKDSAQFADLLKKLKQEIPLMPNNFVAPLSERSDLGDAYLNLESDNMSAVHMLKKAKELADFRSRLSEASYLDFKYKVEDMNYQDFILPCFGSEYIRKCKVVTVDKLSSTNPAHTMVTIGRRMVSQLINGEHFTFEDVYEYARVKNHTEIKKVVDFLH